MRLETLAVSKLMERMVNNGASLEELKKVADYMVTAAVYDEMTGVLLFAKITGALMKGGIHK